MTAKKLTAELRGLLKTPLGPVMDNEEAVLAVKQYVERLITVGDICSYELIMRGIVPHVSIYDGRSLRQGVNHNIVELIERHYAKKHHVKNERGTINEDAIAVIERALADAQNSCIMVDGEEDLLALVAIMKGREGDIVVYGQPNAGAVFVKVDAEVKRKAKMIYDRME